jgi:hypothetical protein
LQFLRRHAVVVLSILSALAVFLALYWLARSTGPAAFRYEIR